MFSSVLALILSACSVQDVGVTDLESSYLVVKDSSEATTATVLDTTVVTGEVYILAEVPKNTDSVAFYLDGTAETGQWLKTDTSLPFDLTMDTRNLTDGEHTITAIVSRTAGSKAMTKLLEASFIVANETQDGGQVGDDPVAGDDPVVKDDPVSPAPAGSLSMLGDPTFTTSKLSTEALYWYDQVWTAIGHPYEEATGWATSANLYAYGRSLNLHVTDLLTALRATGDLQLLDEVDRLAQQMRADLQTKWKDTAGNYYEPTDGTGGYLRWLYFRGDNDWYGKDTHVMDDGLTHAMVAAIAYAYELNRDLVSPGGVNYAERADFWENYLVNHFEAKWRKRYSNPVGTWPIMDNDRPSPLAHTTVQWARYHHYMYLLTGDSGYQSEATRLAKHIDAGFVRLSTPLGTAFVWDHWTIDGSWGAQPTNYARYTVQAVHDLYLEGFPAFSTEGYMTQLANGIAHFVIDNGATDLAADVCGGVDCGGISSSGYNRASMHFFRPFAILMDYDPTLEINSVSEVVYNSQSSHFLPIPVAKVFALVAGS